jgi:hypothetical protein
MSQQSDAPPPRSENSQPALKLDLFWCRLPQVARQAALEALTRIVHEAATTDREVTND